MKPESKGKTIAACTGQPGEREFWIKDFCTDTFNLNFTQRANFWQPIGE